MEKRQQNLPTYDSFSSENTSFQQDFVRNLNLFFAGFMPPNSKQEQQTLYQIIHIAGHVIDMHIPSKNKAHFAARFYKKLLTRKNTNCLFGSIVLLALFTHSRHIHLKRNIIAELEHKTEMHLDNKMIKRKFGSHLKQRCQAFAFEQDHHPAELFRKLDTIIGKIAYLSTENITPPSSLIKEIDKFSKKLATTTLTDVLPSEVSLQQSLVRMMSDHLPQLYAIDGIKVLNWNILSKNLFIGYGDSHNKNSVIETDDEYAARLQHIADFIMKTTELYQIDFVTLQEAYENIKPYFSHDFHLKWDFIFNEKCKIAFIKRKVWVTENIMNVAEKLYLEFQKKKISYIQSNEFQGYILRHKIQHKTLCIYNVYALHEDEPDNLQKALLAIYELHQTESFLKDLQTWIFGDFNRRLPSMDIYARDNATHLVPPIFRNVTIPTRIYDYTDSCFELNNQGIFQHDFQFLNTQNDDEIFERPLVTLNHALKNHHYDNVIFPGQHYIRIIDKDKMIYGSISIQDFKKHLEKLIKQPIEKMIIQKNRFGVIAIHMQCKKSIPLFDKFGIHGSSGHYSFKVAPFTFENQSLLQATEKQKHLLHFVELINNNKEVIMLNLHS